MADRVRWGILGSGAMAEAFVRGLRALPGATVSAVASRSPDRARQFAGRLGIPRATGGFEELQLHLRGGVWW